MAAGPARNIQIRNILPRRPDRRRLMAVAGLSDLDVADLDVARRASGHLPLTPIMGWLSERGGPIDRFSQGMLLQVPAGLSEEHLRSALQALLDHHDALRLRLTMALPDGGTSPDAARGASGDWSLEIAPPGAVTAGACLRRVDVRALDDHGLRGAIATAAEAAEADCRLLPD